MKVQLSVLTLLLATDLAGSVVPGGLVANHNHGSKSTTAAEVTITITTEPLESSAYFWAQQFFPASNIDHGGYFGIQTGGGIGTGVVGKMFIFSIWNATAAEAGPGAVAQTFGGEGIGYSVRMAMAWTGGLPYTFRVEKDGALWWKLTVSWPGGVPVYLGRIQITQDVLLSPGFAAFTEYFGSVASCSALPYTRAVFSAVSTNSEVLPPADCTPYGTCASSARGIVSGTDAIHESGVVPSSSRTVVLPSCVFSKGRNAAEFHSDVRIFNPGSAPVSVTPTFYPQATPGQPVAAAPLTIPPREQVAYDNIIGSLFGRTLDEGAYGPVTFQASSRVLVSSSVNNVNACENGAVSGTWLPGLDLAQALTTGTLVQLAASASGSSGYRSNLVFVNASASAAPVTVKVHKGDGTLLSTGTIGPLPPNGFRQVAIDDAETFPGVAGTTDTNLWAEFTSPQPVLAFASVINNASGDPFAIVATQD